MTAQAFLFFLALFLFGNVNADISDDIAFLKANIESITRQVMLQQFYTEEKVRSDGSSGIKQIRITESGSKNYFEESFVGSTTASIHDDSSKTRLEIGLGEFAAVMNGIEFRTRHNNYRLYMPHETSTDYHAVQEVPFPAVPPEVTEKGSVEEQIAEMREFFKAWKDQDQAHRDYTKYFKPILCYLEATWTIPKDPIEDQFVSSHKLGAESFDELMDKIRTTSYTGYKDPKENLAFLPTKIMAIENDANNISIPVMAQWNYRILCHPLKNDLPLSRLLVVEDVKSRLTMNINKEDYEATPAARYQLNAVNREDVYDFPVDEAFLDELMEEIPGKENYQGYLEDVGFDQPAVDIGTGEPKDVSRYHRWYRSKSPDAMGLTTVHRGFSDDGFYGAMTLHPEVAGMTYEKCVTKRKVTTCNTINQRWSYAIPLEIIYLTPLNNWNPYDIEYKGEIDSEDGKTVIAGGRDGNCAPGKEFDGSNSEYFYRTPVEMFTSVDDQVCVLDNQGNSKQTAASGTLVHLPEIQGLGKLRLRYPIFPVHGEGSAFWKELNAVRDMIMDPKLKAAMRHESFEDIDVGITLEMGMSHHDNIMAHTHTFDLVPWETRQIKIGHFQGKTTSVSNGHSHNLIIMWDAVKEYYKYRGCDGGSPPELCWDNHPKALTIV